MRSPLEEPAGLWPKMERCGTEGGFPGSRLLPQTRSLSNPKLSADRFSCCPALMPVRLMNTQHALRSVKAQAAPLSAPGRWQHPQTGPEDLLGVCT